MKSILIIHTRHAIAWGLKVDVLHSFKLSCMLWGCSPHRWLSAFCYAHHSWQPVAPLMAENFWPPLAPVPVQRVHLPLNVPCFAKPVATTQHQIVSEGQRVQAAIAACAMLEGTNLRSHDVCIR